MDWDELVDDIAELLDNERYKFAWPTLSGIRDTISKTKRVSEGQALAVTNIKRSVSEDERKYEGLDDGKAPSRSGRR